MFTIPLSQTTRRRLLVCLMLLAELLAAGASALPVSAQQQSSDEFEEAPRYWWIAGGPGVGMGGGALTGTIGLPFAKHAFAGGRATYSEEVQLFPEASPPETTWGAGPLIGVLLKQGRYGQLSLTSGVMVLGGRRRTHPKSSDEQSSHCWLCAREYETTQIITVGIPLTAQVFFTPSRYAGIGLEAGFSVRAPHLSIPLAELSLHLIVRVPE